ncbi:MAG TPA: low specificity L-threonine aldolase [Verrucomicrobiae bacterium]|nr:low specificity L-threonine aldolase [Verrucomicrobiae bacterium]
MSASTTSKPRQFASDNNSGICPEAMAALQEANHAHEPGYGNDAWTARAADAIRDVFETDCDVFFVFNGTAANSLSLAALCQSYNSILCHELAHIETAECGAPEFFANGSKVLLLKGRHAKVEPSEIERAVKKRADIHYPKPRVLSLTQATEVGTLYSVNELGGLAQEAKRFGLRIHMDGSRFANAVAAVNVKPCDVTWKAGVDVLCFGGTKNGIAVGEAVVFFNRDLAREFDYRCKQGGQLASKMRFLSAPWAGLLKDGAWLRHASHANAMAKLMEQRLEPLPGARIVHPVQTNSVFAALPAAAAAAMRERGWKFYTHVGTEGEARLMCSWDTRPEDVELFASDLRECLEPPLRPA